MAFSNAYSWKNSLVFVFSAIDSKSALVQYWLNLIFKLALVNDSWGIFCEITLR